MLVVEAELQIPAQDLWGVGSGSALIPHAATVHMRLEATRDRTASRGLVLKFRPYLAV